MSIPHYIAWRVGRRVYRYARRRMAVHYAMKRSDRKVAAHYAETERAQKRKEAGHDRIAHQSRR